MIGLRKALDWVFTQRELKILDDIMPETIKRTEEELRLEDAVSVQFFSTIRIIIVSCTSTKFFTGRKTYRFCPIFGKPSNSIGEWEYHENSLIID